MIDEKKLLKEIKNRKNFWISKASKYDEIKDEMNTDICDGKAMELEVVMKMIQELPKIDKWIPCSERLPENDYDTILVFLDSKIYDIAIWHSEYGFRPWYAAYFESSPPEWEGNVVAWQPLPEPAKETTWAE